MRPRARPSRVRVLYDLIVETIPFERFQEIDAALAEDNTLEFEELTAVRSECAGAA